MILSRSCCSLIHSTLRPLGSGSYSARHRSSDRRDSLDEITRPCVPPDCSSARPICIRGPSAAKSVPSESCRGAGSRLGRRRCRRRGHGRGRLAQSSSSSTAQCEWAERARDGSVAPTPTPSGPELDPFPFRGPSSSFGEKRRRASHCHLRAGSIFELEPVARRSLRGQTEQTAPRDSLASGRPLAASLLRATERSPPRTVSSLRRRRKQPALLETRDSHSRPTPAPTPSQSPDLDSDPNPNRIRNRFDSQSASAELRAGAAGGGHGRLSAPSSGRRER